MCPTRPLALRHSTPLERATVAHPPAEHLPTSGFGSRSGGFVTRLHPVPWERRLVWSLESRSGVRGLGTPEIVCFRVKLPPSMIRILLSSELMTAIPPRALPIELGACTGIVAVVAPVFGSTMVTTFASVPATASPLIPFRLRLPGTFGMVLVTVKVCVSTTEIELSP